MLWMLFRRLGVQQDVVNVDYHKVIHFLSKNGVYRGCECQKCIAQPKIYHQDFIRPIPCATHHFFHILDLS